MTLQKNDLSEFIINLEKAELHAHLEGTVSYQTLAALAEQNSVSLTAATTLPDGRKILPPPAIKNAPPNLRSFDDFISLYLKITEVIHRGEDIVRIAEDYAASAHLQNITTSELYFSPSTFAMFGRNMPSIFEGLIEAQRISKENYSMSLSWIFDIVRNTSRDGMEVINYAVSALKQGVEVVAIGLAGNEAACASPPFAKAFSRARELGFKTTAHAGETVGAQSVHETLECLNPDRIGHGIRALENNKVIEELRERRITVEVCPWSNICLNITSKRNQPIKQMFDTGLKVVIAADDPGIFGKTLLDNYLLAAQLGVTRSQLAESAKRSLKEKFSRT